MFLNANISFDDIKDYRFLLYFDTQKLHHETILNLLHTPTNSFDLLEVYNSGQWRGCWGAMMGITLEFLEKVEAKHSITRLKTQINNRETRMAWERLSALCCYSVMPKRIEDISFFGDFSNLETIHDINLRDKYNYDMYEQDKTRIKDPIIKLWNGR